MGNIDTTNKMAMELFLRPSSQILNTSYIHVSMTRLDWNDGYYEVSMKALVILDLLNL
jgi:hypothetical protein